MDYYEREYAALMAWAHPRPFRPVYDPTRRAWIDGERTMSDFEYRDMAGRSRLPSLSCLIEKG